jgi:hypothetical protein
MREPRPPPVGRGIALPKNTVNFVHFVRKSR